MDKQILNLILQMATEINRGSASIWVIDMFLHVLAWLANLSDNQHIN